MKKIFILLFVFLCCGCSAKYEISFIDNYITDNLSVTYKRNNETNSQIDSLFSNSFYSLGREKLYNYKNNSNSSFISFDLSYKYDVNDYAIANIPNNCFTNYQFFKENDKYYFFADGSFKCGYYAYEYLDSLDIVISTNHVVFDDNSDEQKNGKYIWHVDPNTDDFSLRFVVSDNVKKNNIIMYFLFSILFLILLFGLYIFYRNRKNNEI